jgi:predicted alternative tryptophan synthase beta-subunit
MDEKFMHVIHTYKLMPLFFGGRVHICPSNKTKIKKKIKNKIRTTPQSE